MSIGTVYLLMEGHFLCHYVKYFSLISFDDIILQNDDALQLNSLTPALAESAAILHGITDPQIDCLTAFRDCIEFVEWIREAIDRKILQCDAKSSCVHKSILLHCCVKVIRS